MIVWLFSPMGRAVLILLALGASHGFAYYKGYDAAGSNAEIAALNSAIEGMQQDLDAQRVAAEHARLAAEANGKAVMESNQRIADYETALQARGADSRCLLNDDDVRRLQRPAARSGSAAASRR